MDRNKNPRQNQTLKNTYSCCSYGTNEKVVQMEQRRIIASLVRSLLMREFPTRSESAYLYERAWRRDIFVQYLLQPIDSSRKRSA